MKRFLLPPRRLALLTLSVVIAGLAGSSAAGAYNPYETLNLKLLSPKIARIQVTQTHTEGTLTLRNSKPVVYTFVLTDTGKTVERNITLRFLSSDGVIKATPGYRKLCRAYCFLQWTLRSLGAHQHRKYSVTVDIVSTGHKGYTRYGVSAWGHAQGTTGLDTTDIDTGVVIPSSIVSTTTTTTT